MVEAWKRADADRDGFLTKEEFSTLERIGKLPAKKRDRLFARFDKNGDGKIGRNEILAAAKGRGGKRPMPRLWELDTDKSGSVSYEEFSTGKPFARFPEKRRRKLFDRLDTNRDGVISRADRPKPPPRGGKKGRPDARGPAERDPRRMLSALDEDGDGAVSFEEFRKGGRIRDLDEDTQEDRFMALDRNGDLKLTAEDFPPPGRPDEGKPKAGD